MLGLRSYLCFFQSIHCPIHCRAWQLHFTDPSLASFSKWPWLPVEWPGSWMHALLSALRRVGSPEKGPEGWPPGICWFSRFHPSCIVEWNLNNTSGWHNANKKVGSKGPTVRSQATRYKTSQWSVALWKRQVTESCQRKELSLLF